MSALDDRRYRRPNETCGFDSYSASRKAWDIAHKVQCDVEYLIEEMKNGPIPIPKHALDMLLKHIHRELDDIKLLIEDLDNAPEAPQP